MERRQLEFFLAISEAGSFTGAARTLSIAQPSLSYAVRALEEELGAQLFERHGRGVRLTAAGQALVRPARRTLRSFSQASGAVRGSGEEGTTRLRIAANTVWALDPLVGVLGEMRQLWPRVRMQVSDPVDRAAVVEQVRSGDVDFGLLDRTPPGPPVSSLHMLDLELVAVLPPGTDTGAVTDLATLARRGLVSTLPGTALRTMLDDRARDVGLEVHPVVETAHMVSVVPLVLAGAGAALLPEATAREAAARGARLARLDPPTRASVHLVWRDDVLTDAGRGLLDIARGLARTPAEPPEDSAP